MTSRTLVLALLFVVQVQAVDIPFPNEHSVDDNIDGASSVYAADVDGDGDLDVLGAATVVDTVRWWENNDGFGTSWVEHPVSGVFDSARSVYAADIDGDGDLDILGAAFSGIVAWWENTNRVGTMWTEHTVDGTFNGARWVHAADVDGDGDLDILGAGSTSATINDEIVWWENIHPDGTGVAWTKHTVDGMFDGAASVEGVDVDRDGDMDVVGAGTDVDEIAWWENTNGAGTSWAKHTVGTAFNGARAVHTADVDQDGDMDVLGAGGTLATVNDEIAWWENTNGAGTSWTKHTVDGMFDGATSVQGVDLDADGDLDVLGAARGADDVTWWENTNEQGTSWTEHTIDAAFDGALSAYAADLDGDGDLDALGAALSADDIAWWENKTIHRNAAFPLPWTLNNSFDFASSVDTADVDGDGDTDVVTAGGGDGIAWWENANGVGTSWTEHTLNGGFDGASSVHAADIDGDGDIDVVGAADVDDAIRWWVNTSGTGTTWTERTISGSFDGASSVRAVDLDSDGDLDIVGAGSGGGIHWWVNQNGLGTSWFENGIPNVFGTPFSVFTADMDGDGDEDILGAEFDGDEITWWENAPGTAEHIVDAAFDGATWVHAADMDSDGDMDVLGAAQLADDITWWENTNGVGTSWTEHTVDGGFDGASSVHAADLDGDGDMDVIGTAIGFDDITWWENKNGVGTTWTIHTIEGQFPNATSAHAADVDGDGDVDVLGVSPINDLVTWWSNRGGQFRLPTTSLAPTEINSLDERVVFRIDAIHNGRAGDTDVELVTFELVFEDTGGPLTTNEVNSVIGNLRVYRDSGSGVFEPTDPLVGTISTLSLTNGAQVFSFADGNTDARVVFGTAQRYFVTLDFVPGGFGGPFWVIHATDFSSTGEDRDYDIPLVLEGSPSVQTDPMTLHLPCVPDAFEPDGVSGLARVITAGESQGHNICPVGDEDWVTFSLAAESQVSLVTGGNYGNYGDTVMWLYDAGLNLVEVNDDGGSALFSFIDRLCGVDALSAGSYFVRIDEAGDDGTIDLYALALSVASCCTADLVLSNQTLTGIQSFQATSTATLGPNLIIDGENIDNIVVNAPTVSILGDTTINHSFSIGTTPSCP